MIIGEFSIVKNVIRIDDKNSNYISDPNDSFQLSFNGDLVYEIIGQTRQSLYGKLLLCWMNGVHTFYVILKPSKIVQIDGDDFILCKYLTNHSDMIRGLEDIELVKAFARL